VNSRSRWRSSRRPRPDEHDSPDAGDFALCSSLTEPERNGWRRRTCPCEATGRSYPRQSCLAVFSKISQARARAAGNRGDVQAPARHRLYHATAVQHFVLSSTDERPPVTTIASLDLHHVDNWSSVAAPCAMAGRTPTRQAKPRLRGLRYGVHLPHEQTTTKGISPRITDTGWEAVMRKVVESTLISADPECRRG
jgi:hypothetical protein